MVGLRSNRACRIGSHLRVGAWGEGWVEERKGKRWDGIEEGTEEGFPTRFVVGCQYRWWQGTAEVGSGRGGLLQGKRGIRKKRRDGQAHTWRTDKSTQLGVGEEEVTGRMTKRRNLILYCNSTSRSTHSAKKF